MKKQTVKLTTAAACLALAYVLPFITGNIPGIGKALAPMHIPVLLCGFLCGPLYGLAVGACAPILRSLTIGMPPIFPKGIAMALELAVYGLMTGLLYKLFPKKPVYIYISLFISMICGRLVWGAARFALAGFSATAFPLSAFIAGAITDAIPGIIVQIVVIPVVMIAVESQKNK